MPIAQAPEAAASAQAAAAVCAARPRNRARGFARRQRGVSLIEVLVAAVVLAIGLLGLAGLQLRGMQVNQGSAMRAQAVILAEDLADRMRSDYAATQAGSFFGKYTLANQGSAPVPSLSDWLYGLNALPGGADPASPCPGQALPCVVIQNVTGVATAPIPIQIDVYWNDTRASSGASAVLPPAGTTSVGDYRIVADL
jgi:type IV pilus assembly protein PilV